MEYIYIYSSILSDIFSDIVFDVFDILYDIDSVSPFGIFFEILSDMASGIDSCILSGMCLLLRIELAGQSTY